MVSAAVYTASRIKRSRRTKVEMRAICDAIYAVLEEDRPQSVRHVFYQLSEHPYYLVPKAERGYDTIQRKLLDLRMSGQVPWSWVSDGTRWRRQRQSFDGLAEALRHTAETYRRDLWRRTPVYVEIWCESDSMAGVLIEETDLYNVALMVSRGFSSKTYLYRAAKTIEEENRPAYIYYVGDWDPAGKMIPEIIERDLRAFASEAEIHFQRLLVTLEQIEEWKLPTKPAKKTTHGKHFKGGTVEAEAISAGLARQLVRQAIEQHLDLREVRGLRIAEESEAEYLHEFANTLEDDAE